MTKRLDLASIVTWLVVLIAVGIGLYVLFFGGVK